MFSPCSVFQILHKTTDISRPLYTGSYSKIMPPRKKPVGTAPVTRQSRITKENAIKIIESATKTKPRAPRVTKAAVTKEAVTKAAPPPPPPPPPPPTRPESPAPSSSDSDDSEMSWTGIGDYPRLTTASRLTLELDKRESGRREKEMEIRRREEEMEIREEEIERRVNLELDIMRTGDHDDMEKRVNKAIEIIMAAKEKAAAADKEKSAADKIAEQAGTLPPPPAPPTPHHILRHWSWVESDTVKLIQLGTFPLDNLQKLHMTDDLRNAYLKKSIQGVFQPIGGGPSEILVGTTKLQSAFKEPTTFFLAWQIYVSIRSSYHPNYASGLALWTAGLYYYLYLNYPWPAILEYIIAYYGLYQNSPDKWFDHDPALVSYYLTLHQQRPTTTAAPAQVAQASGVTKSKSSNHAGQKSREPVDYSQMCIMFNRTSGCQWAQNHGGQKCPYRHTCNVCTSDQHNAPNCPKRSTR